MREPPVHSANSDHEAIPFAQVHDTAWFTPLPYNFKSWDDGMQQQSDLNTSSTAMPNANMTSMRSYLVFLLKQVLKFMANLLLGWRMTCQTKDIETNPLSSVSSTYHAPPIPRGWAKTSPSNSLLETVAEKSAATSQQRTCMRGKSSIHHNRASTLPFSLASNRAFLSTHEKQPLTTAPKMKSAGRSSKKDNFVKNPSDILPAPPCGWESFFHPKADEWKCKACYYINPADAMTCDSCTSLKEGDRKRNKISTTSYEADDDESLFTPDDEDEASCVTQLDPSFALAAEEDAEGNGKRTRVNNGGDLHGNNNTARAATQSAREQMQTPAGKGKRIKVDSIEATINAGGGISANNGSPHNSGSKKRNKSEDGDDDVKSNQARKTSREEVERMAMDEASLHNSSSSVQMMDLETP